METKKCSRCGRVLPITEFNWSNKAKGIRQGMCRACFSECNRKRYASDPERFKQAVKEYRKRGPQAVLRTRLGTNEKHPTKQNAQKCVDAAIAAGVLTRPDHRFGCGCPNTEHRIEAHHHDYSKPLDVIWLCTPCHRKMDMARQTEEKRKFASV